MAVNIEFAKKHWPVLAGGVVGLLLLMYILRHGKSGSSASSSSGDISGGANQVQALSAAADLQNSQANAQITMSAYTAGVQNNGIAATLQAKLADTAAQLAAVQNTNNAKTVVALDTNRTAVQLQQVISTAQVQQTAIQGATLENLASSAQAVKLAQAKYANAQINTLMMYSKHFGSDIKAITPALLAETGQGAYAGQVADANSRTDIAKSPASVITAVSSGVGSILTGLFA